MALSLIWKMSQSIQPPKSPINLQLMLINLCPFTEAQDYIWSRYTLHISWTTGSIYKLVLLSLYNSLLLWLVSRCPAKTSYSHWDVYISKVAESRVCGAGIKGVWLLNQSTDWFGMIVACVKGVCAMPTLGQVDYMSTMDRNGANLLLLANLP